MTPYRAERAIMIDDNHTTYLTRWEGHRERDNSYHVGGIRSG